MPMRIVWVKEFSYFSMSFFSKVMDEKDVIGGYSWIFSWNFAVAVYKCTLLKISVLCLKSIISFSWKTLRNNGYSLLFENVINMDQYILRLVLGSNNFLITFEYSEGTETLHKIDCFCYFWDNFCTQHFFHWLNVWPDCLSK